MVSSGHRRAKSHVGYGPEPVFSSIAPHVGYGPQEDVAVCALYVRFGSRFYVQSGSTFAIHFARSFSEGASPYFPWSPLPSVCPKIARLTGSGVLSSRAIVRQVCLQL